ncbi:MAG TPA: hypothetical protein VD866_26130 [Urbifossiella sp.]|nr:hypothetical protein [Urbifossiella sp.]
MADRPQNYCRDCGYQWFPRGHDHAARCPGCRGPNVGAVLSLDDAAPPPPPLDRPSKLPKIVALVVLGVVLHAVAGTLAVYLLRDDPKPSEPKPREPEVAAKAPAPAPKAHPRPVDPPTPRATPKPKELRAPVEPEPEPPEPLPTTPTPPEPAPKTPEPAPKPPDPAPKSPPERTPSPFPPPAGSWESEWVKAGDVRVRVVGVAESKVPLELRKKKLLSPEAYFVVWVEVENTSKTDHKYNRWQPVTTGECTLRYATGAALMYAIYPTDTSRERFTEFTQPLPAGGPPVLESLVFTRPDPAADGLLTLTLDATRAGGTGLAKIEIPHAVWARR